MGKGKKKKKTHLKNRKDGLANRHFPTLRHLPVQKLH